MGRVEAWLAADMQQVGLDRPVQRLAQAAHQPAQTMPEPPAVAWVTPRNSANRGEDTPLADQRTSQSPFSQTDSGRLVACRGVRLVTVNHARQAPSSQRQRPLA